MRKVTINSRKTSKKDATTCIQGDMGHKTPSDVVIQVEMRRKLVEASNSSLLKRILRKVILV